MELLIHLITLITSTSLQLFRVELLNAAQLRKRLEVLGGKIEEDVESEKDLSMGAAAFKIAQLAKKKFPDSPALIYEMLHSAKSMKDPIETLVKKLVVLLMEYETGLFLRKYDFLP